MTSIPRPFRWTTSTGCSHPSAVAAKLPRISPIPAITQACRKLTFNVCGSPGCRCKATPPEKHGPYYQVSFTRKGKSSSKFVRKEDLPAIRKELKNYENMKMLVDRWIDLATELSNLRLKRDRT